MFSRKGISPLIAAFLLVTVTVSIGVFLAGWATQITQGKKAEVKAISEEQEKCGAAFVEIKDAIYDSGTGEITALVHNGGGVNITDWRIDIKYSSVDIETKKPSDSDFVLEPGYKHAFTVTSSKTPTEIEVWTNECPESERYPNARYSCAYSGGNFIC